MLTVLAYVVFIPALLFNIVLFLVMFNDLIKGNYKAFIDPTNLRDTFIIIVIMMVPITIMMVPGVYLFGWY
jgi:hypothetical protein